MHRRKAARSDVTRPPLLSPRSSCSLRVGNSSHGTRLLLACCPAAASAAVRTSYTGPSRPALRAAACGGRPRAGSDTTDTGNPPHPGRNARARMPTRYQLRPHRASATNRASAARMDKVAARALLDQKVRELRQRSSAELRQPQEPAVFELAGPFPGAAAGAAAPKAARRRLVPRRSTVTRCQVPKGSPAVAPAGRCPCPALGIRARVAGRQDAQSGGYRAVTAAVPAT
jgi:hypothetical protein